VISSASRYSFILLIVHKMFVSGWLRRSVGRQFGYN
jgi:hypothetical protein